VARAEILCFIDADVLVQPSTLADFVAVFTNEPDLAAVFGSYDSNPGETDLLSQYRNLLHHYVHQSGRAAASTFWSGCGAIRRSVFLAHNGFDTSYLRPSIEDIELGYRLCAAGERIRLAKHIQVKHLKRWTLWGILVTDIRDRALPWTALIRRTKQLPNDLNLGYAHRLSALSVYALIGCLIASVLRPSALLATPLPVSVLFACNHQLYRFFMANSGVFFAARAVPLHWLYYAYSALAFAFGMLLGGLLDKQPEEYRAPSDRVANRASVSGEAT
jgi:GT2 family glycosyltransferase